MMKNYTLFYTGLLILYVYFLQPKAAVNVALNKPIEAEVTCGTDGPESYYTHSDVYKAVRDRTSYTCDNPNTHPPEDMVNGNLTDYWQSTSINNANRLGYGKNGKPEYIIKIDLENVSFMVAVYCCMDR